MADCLSLSCLSAGLFCTDIRLLCRDTENFFIKMGLFFRRDRALLQRYMALLPRDSALLRTTPGSVSTQGHVGIISSLLLIQGRCNTLQHTATHCNTLQNIAILCNRMILRCSTRHTRKDSRSRLQHHTANTDCPQYYIGERKFGE